MKSSLYDFITILILLLVVAVGFLISGIIMEIPTWAIFTLLSATAALLFYAIFWLAVLKLDIKKLIGFARDVRQKKYDTEIHIARNDEIIELYEELYRMKEELRVMHEREEELLQSVTHNLKMPVSIIYLTAECMRDRIYTEGDFESSCGKIMEMSSELSSQIETLIAINRNQYLLKQGRINEVYCNIKPLIEQQLFELDEMIRQVGLEIETELYNVQFHGSDGEWQSTVQNLIENAMRYARHKIKICLYKTSLSVYNDGECIEEGMLDAIFQSYVLGDRGHSGLGLALVKSMVNLNGYMIEAKNLSDGVVFRIYKN